MAPFPRTTLMAHERHPGGRPTLYKPEYCEAVVKHMAQGLSLTSFAGEISVSVKSLYEWQQVHSEFSHAVKRGEPKRQLFLERKLMKSQGKDTIATIFALKNACPDEWQDRKYTEISHKLSVDQLSTAQLEAIASGHSPRDVIINGTCERVPDTAIEHKADSMIEDQPKDQSDQ